MASKSVGRNACCEDGPHDDPSCLIGSFEDQVLAFGLLLCVGPEQDLESFHVVYSTVTFSLTRGWQPTISWKLRAVQ